jgi:hypothetical protein
MAPIAFVMVPALLADLPAHPAVDQSEVASPVAVVGHPGHLLDITILALDSPFSGLW